MSEPRSKSVEAKVLRTVFLVVFLAGLALGCVLILVAIVFPSHWTDEAIIRWVITPILGVAYGGLGLTGTMVLQKGKLVWMMRAGLVGISLAALWWLRFAWSPAMHRSDAAEANSMVGVTLTLPALGVLLCGHLLAVETKSSVIRNAAWGAVGLLAAFIAMVVGLIWTIDSWDRYAGVISSLMSVWGLATLCSMLAVPAAARFVERKKPVAKESIASVFQLELTCPRCKAELTLPSGIGRCSQCRFALFIEVEEPRCECGYLLFRLETSRCPECGRGIPTTHKGVTP